MIAVYLHCVLRARYDLLLDTEGLCDESSMCCAENKCTAQVRRVDGVTHKLPYAVNRFLKPFTECASVSDDKDRYYT